MKVLQVHCTYKFQGGEDSVVANERELLRSSGVVVEELLFSNEKQVLKKVLQTPFNFQSYRVTRQKIQLFKPDIVHIHNLHFAASPSVIYAIQRSGVPFVQTLHNYRLICPSAILYNNGKLFLNSIRQRFPWTAIAAGVYHNSVLLTGWLALSNKLHQWIGTWEKPNRYIVLTKHAQSLFQSSRLKFSKEQLSIKPNFSFSGQSFSGHTAPIVREDHFVFIGRLSEEKGIRLLLQTFASLPYRIKIAGDGPLLKEVLDYSKRYKNIEYVGILAKEAVFPFLAGGTALVFPSTWYEGMPMVIIEAFASRLPVIASRLGAMEEMITAGYNGLHFDAGSIEALQAAVTQYYQLPVAEKNILCENAYNTYLKNYTPEKNAEQLIHIYKDVINEVSVSEVASTPAAYHSTLNFLKATPAPLPIKDAEADKLNVFSIPINIGSYREVIATLLDDAQHKRNYYTCVANVHMLVEAYRDAAFANTVKNAHVITPDGRPLTWAIRMFYGIKQERVAGMDLLPDLLKQAEANQIPIYFYGGHPDMVERTRLFLQEKYPNLTVAGLYSPPFKKLSVAEEEEVIRQINQSGAQMIFVSLGCPKQEKWMAAVANRVNGVMIGIGGALSVMIGERRRAPHWVQAAGLEWLFRLSQEPGRLFKRYAVTNSIFIYLFIRSYLRNRFFHHTKNVIDFNRKMVINE